jgi:crotonobetainyl-CoA:carnitine CoA-transferase CaiB-like acyl-CoA transferase
MVMSSFVPPSPASADTCEPGETPLRAGALSHIRICDLGGQLAAAGATRYLAAFGAEVIRVEDPLMQGRWDIWRAGLGPFVDERRGVDMSGAFNNHNVGKLGVTLNLRTARGQELLEELVRRSDALTENFAAGVLARLGFPWERLRELNPSLVYVSHTGFGHSGPYGQFRSWGPIVQAVGGLTFLSGLPDLPPAGWGFSLMDHVGAGFMAMAVLAGIRQREATGEGQWIDISCTELAVELTGPAILDSSINGRPLRADGFPDSNHSQSPRMAPHGVYPASGDDNWVAIACRDDADWDALVGVVNDEWTRDQRLATAYDRLANEDFLDANLAMWSRQRDAGETAGCLLAAGVPASQVARPEDRIEHDPVTAEWRLWPWVEHPKIGRVRVEGIPVHLSETDWSITSSAPCLGQDNDRVLGGLLGLGADEIAELRTDGVV